MGSKKHQQAMQQAIAKRAYRLRCDGFTNKEIAALIQKPVENIPKWIAMGQRLQESESSEQP